MRLVDRAVSSKRKAGCSGGSRRTSTRIGGHAHGLHVVVALARAVIIGQLEPGPRVLPQLVEGTTLVCG